MGSGRAWVPFQPQLGPWGLFWVMPKGSSPCFGARRVGASVLLAAVAAATCPAQAGPTCRSFVRAPLSRTTEAGGGAGTTVPPRPACPPALPRAQSPRRPHRGTRDPLNPVTRRRSSQLPSHCFARNWDALRLCLRVPWSQNKPEAPTSPGPEPSLLPVLTTDPGRTEKHGPSLGSDPREDPWLPRQQWNPQRCLIKLRPPTAPLPAGEGRECREGTGAADRPGRQPGVRLHGPKLRLHYRPRKAPGPNLLLHWPGRRSHRSS